MSVEGQPGDGKEGDLLTLHARAPGKVNLALFLGPARQDGRHELVTLFQAVSLSDELTLTVGTVGTVGEAGVGGDQVICPGVEGPNLAAAALAGLRARGWEAPPVRLEIEKHVPVAAGMGGGSADAAAALRLAVEVLPGRPEEVAGLAAELGSDVPSQLVPGLVLGTGAGDLVEPYPPLPGLAVVIVPQQGRALSTPEVFAEADRLGLPRSRQALRERYEELVETLRVGGRPPASVMVNDLQPAALSLCPEVGEALGATETAGAETALVSGSGPTVAGFFWGQDADERARRAAETLVAEYPRAVAAQPVTAEYALPRAA